MHHVAPDDLVSNFGGVKFPSDTELLVSREFLFFIYSAVAVFILDDCGFAGKSKFIIISEIILRPFLLAVPGSVLSNQSITSPAVDTVFMIERALNGYPCSVSTFFRSFKLFKNIIEFPPNTNNYLLAH